MQISRRFLALTLTLSSLVGVSALGSSVASARPTVGATSQAAIDYIVRFTKGTNVAGEVAAQRKQGIEVSRTFIHVFPGAVMRLNATQLAALRKNPRVATIEADGVVSIDDTQSGATWGLDRIDQRALPLSGSYTYPASGAGVTAYIVDTGILASHGDFGGRVTSGYSAIADGGGTTDCNGHGTHVAGTVGGSTWGVAKSVTLVPVRVLDCAGSGSYSGVIAGLEWIIANHADSVPAVANMSLGGPAYSLLDDAVQKTVSDGVTMVVAAGNSNTDACTSSPARAASAITVGATSSNDARASYSNFGTCLDIFAPGSGITSAWYTSNTATNTISGTSMASPHVAGAAAVLLSLDNSLSPAAVVSSLTGSATTGVVTSAGTGSPNRLLFVGDSTTPPPPSATAPSAPTNVKASAGRRSAVVSWTQGSNGGSALTAQSVVVYRGTTRVGSVNVSATAVSVNIGGLTGGVTYTFRVTATNAFGTSPESAPSNAVTVRK